MSAISFSNLPFQKHYTKHINNINTHTYKIPYIIYPNLSRESVSPTKYNNTQQYNRQNIINMLYYKQQQQQ